MRFIYYASLVLAGALMFMGCGVQNKGTEANPDLGGGDSQAPPTFNAGAPPNDLIYDFYYGTGGDSQSPPILDNQVYEPVPQVSQEVSIDKLEYDTETQLLTVTVSSEPSDYGITVSVYDTDSMTVDAPFKDASQGDGLRQAVFHWRIADIMENSATESISVIARGEYAGLDSDEIVVSVKGIELLPDTIYAVPLHNYAYVGESVRVVVATGELAHPFQYMVGANVTCEDFAFYKEHSFNPGSIGGDIQEVDGIWTGVDPIDFLYPGVFLFEQEKADLEIQGRHRLEFTVVPLFGHDALSAQGGLFNFELTFTEPGVVHLGFIEYTPPIDRTYYRDDQNNDYYWGTLMAGPDGVLNVEGVDNTITVIE